MKKHKKNTNYFQYSPEELLDDYQECLEAGNRSQKTISGYLDSLRGFFKFLKENNLHKPISKLGRDELRKYALRLRSAGKWANHPHIKMRGKGQLSPYTIEVYIKDIKIFWSWLCKEGHVKNNPLATFPLPKVPKRIVPTLSCDQVKKLLAGTDKARPVGVMRYCMLLLLYDTGMRVSELVNLKIDDLDLKHKVIKVTGKGSKQRLLPISRFTKKAISKYLSHDLDDLCRTDSPYLFPSPDGEAFAINSIEQFFRRLALKCGFSGVKCTPHTFRHSFATKYIANGGNLETLRIILGHESILTTVKYTHLDISDIQKQHTKFSPVNELFNK